MNPNNRGQQATTKPTLVERIIKRLTQRIEADGEPKHPGVIMSYDAKEYDYGGYSDPMIDDRPDFIKEDERGWQVLK